NEAQAIPAAVAAENARRTTAGRPSHRPKAARSARDRRSTPRLPRPMRKPRRPARSLRTTKRGGAAIACQRSLWLDPSLPRFHIHHGPSDGFVGITANRSAEVRHNRDRRPARSIGLRPKRPWPKITTIFLRKMFASKEKSRMPKGIAIVFGLSVGLVALTAP